MKFHNTIIALRDKLAKLEEVKLTKNDIDEFYNKVNSLDFRFSLFGKYYQKYIDNLNRFKPLEENDFDLTFLKIAIAEDQWKPTEFPPVLIYHIKYKYKLTSKFFISRQKKENLKKLNSPGKVTKGDSKFDSTKTWTRIPIRNQCESGCGCSE